MENITEYTSLSTPPHLRSDSHYMAQHLFACPSVDATKVSFNVKKPKSILRTSRVSHFNSHVTNTCLAKSAVRLSGKCYQRRVSKEDSVVYHYR